MSLDQNSNKTQTSLESISSPSQLLAYASFSSRVLNRVLCPYQKAKNLALDLKRLIRPLEISWHNLSLITLNFRYCDTSSLKPSKPQVNGTPSFRQTKSAYLLRRRNAASLRRKSDFQNSCLV